MSQFVRKSTTQFVEQKRVYSRICLVGGLSNRRILPKIDLTGQFCFFGICLTRQLENFDRLTVLVMLNKSLTGQLENLNRLRVLVMLNKSL